MIKAFKISLFLIFYIGKISISSSAIHRVLIFDGYQTYLPDEGFNLEVKVGDTIQWYLTGKPTFTHSITSTNIPTDASPFNFLVPAGSPADTLFNYKVEMPGKYNYGCNYHSTMKSSFQSTVLSLNHDPIDENRPILILDLSLQKISIGFPVIVTCSYRIYDINGKTYLTNEMNNERYSNIDMSSFPSGLYLVHIKKCVSDKLSDFNGGETILKFFK